jgi:ABC-2 type transport system ATP-binding protein
MGRYQVREIILSLKAQGKTIFFNSHILSDVSLICDRIAILARGELLCIGSLDELLGTEDHYQVTVKINDGELLKNWLDDLYFQDNCWHGTLNKEPEEFMANLNGINGQLISINLARPSLEDFFIQQLQERGIYTSR